MAPISPGFQLAPSRKAKKQTMSTKLHRYESFSQRIARLRIDPVHTVEKVQPLHDDKNLLQSYFRTSLEKWAELNLSQSFTDFLNKVNPLCENLPQLLHHADAVLELLLDYIGKKEKLSLEPLLDLLAQFSHDLGQSFERFFARSAELVARVAASHDDAEVVEWCFTCLAWKLKYLSKLLVQDLRPLLGIMIPYLSSSKDYVIRFTAESLSFLLRRAAILYQKNKDPLTLAIRYLLEEMPRIHDSPSYSPYQLGLMSLCVDTARGLDGQLHSCSGPLVRCLLEISLDGDEHTRAPSVVQGILIGLIHETNSDSFRPVLEVTLEAIRHCALSQSASQVDFAIAMLSVLVGTRKGSRVSDWSGVIKTYQFMATATTEISTHKPQRNSLLASVMAEVIQFTPMDQLLPFSSKLLDFAAEQFSVREFFAFSTFAAELGKERFMDLIVPKLQRYIIEHWSDHEVVLSYTLERLRQNGLPVGGNAASGSLGCPSECEPFAIRALRADNTSDNVPTLQELAGRLRFVKNTHHSKRIADQGNPVDVYHHLITAALDGRGTDFDLRSRVILGWGFESYLDIVSSTDERLTRLSEQILASTGIHFRMPTFLHAASRLLTDHHHPPESYIRAHDNMRNVLIRNLLGLSPQLKKKSLDLLLLCETSDAKQWLNNAAETMLEIMETAYAPSEARKIAMLLRRLPQLHQDLASTSSYKDFIPFFCLGLMSQYHDQTRRELCNILAQLAQTASTEELVVNVALEWLQTPKEPPQLQKTIDDSKKHMSSFECAQLAQINALCSSVFDDFRHAEVKFERMVEQAHHVENVGAPQNGRSLALQVLSAIPASAERRSRLLVPMFLAVPWSRGQLAPKPTSDTSVSSHTLTPDLDDHDWSLSDRKALLTLFSKFVNPRVLSGSQDVYQKSVDLLSNGSDIIRKLALEAILTWKDPTVSLYKTKLMQLAEGKLATSEIGAMLSPEEGADLVQTEERQVVLPLVLRLVYGTIVGRAGTSGSQDARRKSLLRTLFRLPKAEISDFLRVALGSLNDVSVVQPSSSLTRFEQSIVPADQRYGFLRLLLSMLETLQSSFHEYGGQVVDAVVYCIIGVSGDTQNGATPALSRNIRRTGFQCLVLLFEHCQDIAWPLYLSPLFASAISPRLDIFASETTQGISSLLRLFAVWTHSPETIQCLTRHDNRIPSVLWHALGVDGTPVEVKVFILNEIVLPWIDLAENNLASPNEAEELLVAESEGLLKSLIAILERTPPKDVLGAVTTILIGLAPFTKSSNSSEKVVKLLTSLLCDAKVKVAPNVKSQLLRSVHGFLHERELLNAGLCVELVGMISPLFNYFKDESSRRTLCEVLARLDTTSETSVQVSQLCKGMNAVSSERLDVVDYDKRLQAFQAIQDLPVDQVGHIFSSILYNLLFFVRTSEDFTIRSNALGCLRHMMHKACEMEDSKTEEMVLGSVLPVVKKGLRHDSELIRADFVSILGLLVQLVHNNGELANMSPLLVGNDDEASFFLNVLHIQQHRRHRAIRRLVSEIEKGIISTRNIVEIFIPLLEMFIQDPGTDESIQSTKGQAIAAMSTILQWLDWKHFMVLFRRYRVKIDVTNKEQKAATQLLGHATDALLSAEKSRSDIPKEAESSFRCRLAQTLPDPTRVAQELRSQFIPKLAELIHYKDEAEISLRLPVAVIAMKLITLLPPDEIPFVASPVILDIANILRSRAQEARDAARKALCEIVTLIGPSSLQFVVKGLRTALTRGYQLHVVSYTLHAILVAMSAHGEHGQLDYCVEDLVPVIMDDIFGIVGQEKDNQDYISSMKEVKSSKSFDSMEHLARSISLGAVMKLVAPLQTLLSGSLTTKQVRQVDELLRRTGMGLAQNPVASKRDTLTFAYQLIQKIYEQKTSKNVRTPTNDERNRQRYLIQLSSAHKTTESRTSAQIYKLAKFALDLVRSTLSRYADLLIPENVHGFLPVIGDALIEGQEDVKISALRLLSAIGKLPMQELEDNAALYVSEAVKIVNTSTNTNEEGAQAALKLVATLLRERRSVEVRDSTVAQLLHRITSDIEEPDKQGVTFNFIRAVMARKIQTPEVYELADKIAIMMVTNHTAGARDVARGVYVHFLLEYPQSTSRWSKQQKFLMKNLEYEYPEGRQSVMEAINTLIGKMKGDAAQEAISGFFVPILLRVINDDNEGCRKLAGALLGKLFKLADQTRLAEMFQPLGAWAKQDENLALQTVSLQAYGILLDADVSISNAEISQIRDNVSSALKASEAMDEDGWELQFQALSLLHKLAETRPGAVLDRKHDRLWSSVWSSLRHSNPWIQSTTATLCIQFFSHCVSADRSKLPLICEFGLPMDSDAFIQVLKSSLRVLRYTEDEALSGQMMQILSFLGFCLDQNGLSIRVNQKPANGEEDSTDDGSNDEDEEQLKPTTISGIQYLLDQLTRILRIEANRLTSAAFLPRRSSLQLLTNLIPEVSMANLPRPQIHNILLPLQHLTDPNTIPPRSADPTFAGTYQGLIELAHEVMEKVQKKLGDAEYVKALTEVSKIVRDRREQRRTKRRIERVAEPEKAAREKKKKHDRTKERKREIGRTHQRRRREVG